jgi:hypothetical protein
MSASKFLTTNNNETISTSVARGLRDLRNPDANNGKRSLYSLSVKDGKEMPLTGAYGATDSPIHPIEQLGDKTNTTINSGATVPAKRS